MQNKQVLAELLRVLEDMAYFDLYPSSRLKSAISMATSDGDRIRLILRDSAVQEYLFPDYKTAVIHDPRAHYVALRKSGTIPGHKI